VTQEPPGDPEQVDPKEFLRALLRLSPDDARKAREASPPPPESDGQEGPFHDYDEDDANPS
jgi:hypothetical protein